MSFHVFLEEARSERSWKNVRNYISTLEEYFTYMTERQKTITLQFLYEILSYQDVDIRMQAARLMGNIVATFEEKYRKENSRRHYFTPQRGNQCRPFCTLYVANRKARLAFYAATSELDFLLPGRICAKCLTIL